MKSFNLNLLLAPCLPVVIGLAGCQTATAPTAPSPPPESWSNRMQEIGQTFATLLPLSFDPIQFDDPNNQDLINRSVDQMSQFLHDAGETKAKPTADPGLEFMAKQFSGEMTEAKRQLRFGNRQYARYLIRNSSSYCISCHTQVTQGPQFLANPSTPYFKKMNIFDQADYLIAVRNFDLGLEKYRKAMNSPDAALQPFRSLESSSLHALAVAVRVKRDPALALAIVGDVIQSKWAPVYLQVSAMTWRTSLRDWQKATEQPKNLEQARELMRKGWLRQMSAPLSRAGLIENLRASAVLHDLLYEKHSGRDYAETLYYTGLASEQLHDLDPVLLSETYFESCIRQYPHSETARNCYLRLEGDELADYAAVEGAEVPVAVRQHLASLKDLAEVPDHVWLEWQDHR